MGGKTKNPKKSQEKEKLVEEYIGHYKEAPGYMKDN